MNNDAFRKQPTRVLIADSDVNAAAFLSRELFKAGYDPVSTEIGGVPAIHAARELRPDVVIVDADLADICGVEAASIIQEESIAPVVLVASEVTPDMVRRATRAMVHSIMVKPIQITRIVPSIEIAISQWSEMLRQTGRISKLREKDETREIVTMAKRVLIETRELTETMAYRTMRDLSMTSRRPMKAVAEEILRDAKIYQPREHRSRTTKLTLKVVA